MIKLSILYHEPADKETFENFYNANLALVERMPNVIRRQVNHVFGAPGGPPPYYRILEVYFKDREAMDQAMRSEAGVAAGHHLMSFAAELADLFFSEVYEEEGGHTETTSAPPPAAQASDSPEMPPEAGA